MISLVSQKRHMRVDHDEDDAVIKALIQAAIAMVNTITGLTEDSEENPMYDQAIHLLVAHWYNNREAASEVSYKDIPYGLRQLFLLLRTDGDF